MEMKGLLHLMAGRFGKSPAASPPPETSSQEIARKVAPAVVLIKGAALDGSDVAGTGFVVDESGTIVTNLHVIENLSHGAVRMPNGDIYDHFNVHAFDERKDIAIIQVAGFGLPKVDLGDSDEVQPGQRALLFGNPLGLEGSISEGIVSAIRRLKAGYRVIQTDAAANPGNSGGPLVDAAGRAVGILSFMRVEGENLNFAVPINYARGMLAQPDSFPLGELRSKLEKTPDMFSPAPAATPPGGAQPAVVFPSRWKSMVSGVTRIVRLDPERIYLETVLPRDRKDRGDFVLAELSRAGNKFEGKERVHRSCRAAWTGWKSCTEELAIEITSLSPTRIEGSKETYPDDDKLRCRSCTHTKPPSRVPFVWIPEE
jgi:hypothetical protein